MAYTLTDPFSGLRTVLRLSGSLALVAGVILLLLPGATLPPAIVTTGYPLWPLRLVAALLLTLGVFFLLAANRRIIEAPTMVACTVANGSVALVLVIAYLQQEFAALAFFGRSILVLVCLLCLVCAVTPLRYLRAELREE